MKRAVESGLTAALIGCIAGCPMGNHGGSGDSSARVRAVHASPDAPAVDVCAAGSALFSGASFPGATAYAVVTAGTYDVKVVPAGAGCSSAGVIEAPVPLNSDTDTTIVALNRLSDIEPLVLTDDNTAPAAGQARVRFVHASLDAPAVDITLPDGTTLFNDIAFKENGGYVQVPAGTYSLQVRDETGAAVVRQFDDVTLAAGKVYTIFAVGLLNGDPALDVLISVDN